MIHEHKQLVDKLRAYGKCPPDADDDTLFDALLTVAALILAMEKSLFPPGTVPEDAPTDTYITRLFNSETGETLMRDMSIETEFLH